MFLRVFADDRKFAEDLCMEADGSYAHRGETRAGLAKYRIEFGTRSGGEVNRCGTAQATSCAAMPT